MYPSVACLVSACWGPILPWPEGHSVKGSFHEGSAALTHSHQPSFCSAASSPWSHTVIAIKERATVSDVRHEALEWANDHFRLIGDGPLGIVVLRATLFAKHSALSQQYVVYRHAHVQQTALLIEAVLFRTCISCFFLIPSCFLWVPFFSWAAANNSSEEYCLL